MNTAETIRKIRTELMPRHFGVEITQRQFGLIVSGVARKLTGSDIKCMLQTVQDWEYGKFQPSYVAEKAIAAIYETVKDAKPRKEIGRLPWFKKDWEEPIAKIVEQISDKEVMSSKEVS